MSATDLYLNKPGLLSECDFFCIRCDMRLLDCQIQSFVNFGKHTKHGLRLLFWKAKNIHVSLINRSLNSFYQFFNSGSLRSHLIGVKKHENPCMCYQNIVL